MKNIEDYYKKLKIYIDSVEPKKENKKEDCEHDIITELTGENVCQKCGVVMSYGFTNESDIVLRKKPNVSVNKIYELVGCFESLYILKTRTRKSILNKLNDKNTLNQNKKILKDLKVDKTLYINYLNKIYDIENNIAVLSFGYEIRSIGMKFLLNYKGRINYKILIFCICKNCLGFSPFNIISMNSKETIKKHATKYDDILVNIIVTPRKPAKDVMCIGDKS